MSNEEKGFEYLKEIRDPVTTSERTEEILDEIFKDEDLAFQKLDSDMEKQFIKYAEENDPQDMKCWHVYHPVCRRVWIKRGIMPEHIRPFP